MNLSRRLLRLLLGSRLPVTTGDLRVPGLSSPVTIRRNKWGIPAIDAESDVDAAFGLGFCHAQDRAGQLELMLRVGRGTLSEWVGLKGLPTDRLSRRLGFHRSAVKQLAALAPHIREAMAAYVRGINAGFAHGLSKKPHEFAILGGKPTPWDETDVLSTLQLQSFSLPSNWDVELARLRLLLSDGPDAVRDLDPLGKDKETGRQGAKEIKTNLSPNLLVSLSPCLAKLAEDLAMLQHIAPLGGGSNNWVLAGTRTTSGKPILASDPHLSPGVPPPWYVAHIRTPDGAAVGAGIPGAPGIAIGHNGFAAWGVTAGLTDNTDLFIETLGTDGVSVREVDGSFTPCEVAKETIRVKGAADVVEDVLVTPRGPLVTPLLPGVSQALSFRAVWLDPLPVDGLLSAVKADSFESFKAPFKDWPVLPLHIVYGDTKGTIGRLLTGQLPRRKRGHGIVPLPADAAGVGWEAELLPLDEMPCETNPERGFLATANEKPPTSAAAPFLGLDFIDDFRARTITDELSKRSDWTIADTLRLQCNVRSIPWEELRPLILAIETEDASAKQGLALLRSWNGEIEANSPAATVFELFTAEMCVRVAKAKAPNGWRIALGESEFGAIKHNLFCDRRVGHLIHLLREQPGGWFARSWPEELADALATVTRKLQREVGPGEAYWGWGHLRLLRCDHPLFRKSRVLGPAFNLGPVPLAGDSNTISQAGARPTEPLAFTHNIANLRMAIDLADLAASRFILCGGQSGNPCSPHYDDQFPLWQAGDSIPLPWDRNAIIRDAKATLRLLPAN